ncbi:MAG TPA: 2-C-methyl-D-erythritol 4-phosphate cytidylyltransferase [Actinomycetota bacterium]|nr:2-C-methyl-D-erythritol 4-phosphate cytidylyltransferase [Actinomycetota bacterium]
MSGRAVAISDVAAGVTGAAAVVLAAGRSERLAGSVPKPFLGLAGRRVLDYSLAALRDAPSIGSIVVVVPEALRSSLEGDLLAVPKVVAVVAGGPSRQGSLVLGLASVARVAAAGVVAVHDAARPLVTPGILEEVVGAVAGEFDGAIAAIPLDDAVKEVGDAGAILGLRSRVGLWRAQTPQAFRRDCIEASIKQAVADGVACDDCSEMATRAGYRVRVVAGSVRNMKITRPGDIELCQAILAATGPPVPGQTG